MAMWLKDEGPENDIVASTRVRLARNLAGVPFPHRIAGTERAAEIQAPVRAMFLRPGMDFSLTEMRALSPLERTRMVEQHLISRDLAKSPDGAVLLSPDQTVGIMMMEEDHYRLQCIKSGFQVDAALKGCQELERMLGEKAQYAFDEELGYLTACPTNLGTGLRIGVMMHLKGLAVTGALPGILSSLGQFGATARGIYGEGTESRADMYQISNQTTLGIAEEDIAKNLVAGGTGAAGPGERAVAKGQRDAFLWAAQICGQDEHAGSHELPLLPAVGREHGDDLLLFTGCAGQLDDGYHAGNAGH